MDGVEGKGEEREVFGGVELGWRLLSCGCDCCKRE